MLVDEPTAERIAFEVSQQITNSKLSPADYRAIYEFITRLEIENQKRRNYNPFPHGVVPSGR